MPKGNPYSEEERRARGAASAARYRSRNPEKHRAAVAAWVATHSEHIVEYRLAYNAAHRGKSTVWQRENPDKKRAYAKKWLSVEANRAKYREIKSVTEQRRRVRIKGGETEKIQRLEIFERDGWTCGICGEPIDPTIAYPSPLSKSIDHIIPVSKGGSHTRANVQAAHLACNSRKRDRLT